jgi:dihydrofolate reductase
MRRRRRTLIQQAALQARLVDSLHLHVVVLGAGTRLFDNLADPIELERTESWNPNSARI